MAFKLYETHGISSELLEEFAQESGTELHPHSKSFFDRVRDFFD